MRTALERAKAIGALAAVNQVLNVVRETRGARKVVVQVAREHPVEPVSHHRGSIVLDEFEGQLYLVEALQSECKRSPFGMKTSAILRSNAWRLRCS